MAKSNEAGQKRIGRNVKTNGYSNVVRVAEKARRRAEAEERNANWQKLSPEEQLKYINTHFPDGAKRQRARLMKQLEGK